MHPAVVMARTVTQIPSVLMALELPMVFTVIAALVKLYMDLVPAAMEYRELVPLAMVEILSQQVVGHFVRALQMDIMRVFFTELSGLPLDILQVIKILKRIFVILGMQ